METNRAFNFVCDAWASSSWRGEPKIEQTPGPGDILKSRQINNNNCFNILIKKEYYYNDILFNFFIL